MKKSNPLLQQAILEVVDNQLRDLNHPETKQTYDRLRGQGHSDPEARRLIGCVVSAEIFDVLKQQQSFNKERFVKALNNLPQMPWDK